MRADSCRRAVPERLVEEEEAFGVSDGERGSTWAKVSRASALDVGSNCDHSIDSCFLIFRAIKRLRRANRQGSQWALNLAVPLSWGSSPVRPETLRRHLSVVLPLSKSRGAEDASLCQPAGVMNLSLSSNGHVSPKEQHRCAGSLNPFPTEFVKSRSARPC